MTVVTALHSPSPGGTRLWQTRPRLMVLVFIQVSGDVSDTDRSGEARHPRTRTDAAQDPERSGPLAMQVSEKEMSSGEDQESEPRTESEAQRESLSSEDSGRSVREELRKVGARKARRRLPFCRGGRGAGCVPHLHRDVPGSQRALPRRPSRALGKAQVNLLDQRRVVQSGKQPCVGWTSPQTSRVLLTTLLQDSPLSCSRVSAPDLSHREGAYFPRPQARPRGPPCCGSVQPALMELRSMAFVLPWPPEH